VASLLKYDVRTKSKTVNAINTDLRAFFEAKEGALSSSALFLSLIVAMGGVGTAVAG